MDAPGLLLLENDADLANSIRVFLEDSYEVFIVQDPDELLACVARHRIHLIITDVDVAHPNLEKNLKKVRTADPQIKVLLMYLFLDEDEVSEKSIFLDADDIIIKPFDVNVLRHKLDRLHRASQFNSSLTQIH